MMKRYLYLIIICVLGLFSSCKKYLDVKPYDKVIPKTTEEFSAFLHSLLNDVDYGYGNHLLGTSGDVVDLASYSDNLDASIKGHSSVLKIYVGDDNGLNMMQLDYSELYSTIRDLNIVLNNVKDVTEEDKDVRGAAYTMRAVCYFNLIRQFSPAYEKGNADNQLGVPKVTVYDIEAQPVRSSLEEMVTFIESDLNNAIELNSTKEIYRFTAEIAKFYLLRLYFISENWNALIPLAEEFNEKYTLLAGAQYVEMMGSVNDIKGNVLLKSFVFGDNGSIFNYRNDSKHITERPVSADFIKLFKEKEADVRYALSFNDKRETVKVLNARIRAAEVYFMLAEAYAHRGENGKALQIVNEIRDNRITGNVHYEMETLPQVDPDYIIKVDCEGNDLTPLMYTILTERQKEFFVEGDRWWELKRNGSPEFWVSSDIGLKYTTYKYMYTAPIRKRDIDINKGLIQNEGYED